MYSKTVFFLRQFAGLAGLGASPVTNARFQIVPGLLALGLLLGSCPLAAQSGSDEKPRWYQVEVLIFANRRATGDTETWRKDIELRYPHNWVVLQDPNQLPPAAGAGEIAPLMDTKSSPLGLPGDSSPLFGSAPNASLPDSSLLDSSLLEDTAELAAQLAETASLAAAAAESSAAESTANTGKPDTPATAAATSTDTALDPQGTTTGEPTATGEEGAITAENPAPVIKPVDLLRDPYYLLPASQRALERDAKAIQRSYNYRLLFHEAWRQPVVDQPEAPSLLISAGDKFGQQHELEGTIALSVSRYLHLQTNLWFTRFTHNYGQERGNWPELPQRPDQREFALATAKSPSAWQQFSPPTDDYDKILATPFLPERISILRQKRRMRSGEVHYIDHPHLGIVILCTPYDVPPPAAAGSVQ